MSDRLDAVLDPLVPRPIDLPTAVPLDRRDLSELDEAKIFAGPDLLADRERWRAVLHRWRDEARARHVYSGARYDDPRGSWTQSAYGVGLVWLWDELLYDHETRRFTPERLVEDARERFGGHDAVVLWHAYPVIGLDERNQWDYYREVPGLAELVRALRGLGLRVFVDYNPWDVGTRRTGRSDETELADLVRDLGVDGVFLDTLKEAGGGLVAALDAVRPAVALEGESKVPLARVEDHALSWAQWFADSPVPGVLRSRWYEPRHMVHHTRRWNRDHSAELQSAWVNGAGVLVWESVFGAWVGWSARDRATLRRMLRVQRAATDLLVHGRWTPLADDVEGDGVYASRFDSSTLSLWALVNRGDDETTATLVVGAADELVDLGAGVTLDGPRLAVPARGIAAVLAIWGHRPTWVDGVIRDAAADRGSADSAFPERPVVRTPVPRAEVTEVPEGFAAVRPGRRPLRVTYRRRETGFDAGAPYVEEWKPLPPRLHDLVTETREVDVGRIAVAALEVSVAEFAGFLDATGYEPVGGRPSVWAALPSDATDRPMTEVDLTDARAFARWRGARLPTEHEWQAAAEDGVLRRRRPHVWSWTESEHTDGRARWWFAKGGSDVIAEGSEWYVDGGVQDPSFSVKVLMLGGGLARSSRVGFRLAVDLP